MRHDQLASSEPARNEGGSPPRIHSRSRAAGDVEEEFFDAFAHFVQELCARESGALAPFQLLRQNRARPAARVPPVPQPAPTENRLERH